MSAEESRPQPELQPEGSINTPGAFSPMAPAGETPPEDPWFAPEVRKPDPRIAPAMERLWFRKLVDEQGFTEQDMEYAYDELSHDEREKQDSELNSEQVFKDAQHKRRRKLFILLGAAEPGWDRFGGEETYDFFRYQLKRIDEDP